jgi:hypothetical protein
MKEEAESGGGFSRARAVGMVTGLMAFGVSCVISSYFVLFARYPDSIVSLKRFRTDIFEVLVLPYGIVLLFALLAAKAEKSSIRKIGVRISAAVAAWALITSVIRAISVKPYATDMWFLGMLMECALTTAVFLIAALAVYFGSNREIEPEE